MDQEHKHLRILRPYAAVFLTVLAPFLGGSVRPWAQGTIALMTGVVFLALPPRKSPGIVANTGFSILLLLSLFAFLPAEWFPTPDWRARLLGAGVLLPRTVTPQPWITLHTTLLLLLQISWAYYLFALDWNGTSHRVTMTIFGIAITLLAGILIFRFLFRYSLPFWPNVPEFGFFPNRNHTSNVLGLGGIIIYALTLTALDQRRREWWIGIVGLSVICSALVLNYSRAGIILLCGGILVVHCTWIYMSMDRRRSLLAAGLVAILIALLVYGGGKTAARFVESSDFFDVTQNTRFGIQRDALRLSCKMPLTGVGLGNFSPVFTMYGHDSIPGKIAAHPESDWVWATVELGWLAPILIAILFIWWARNCFPFDPGTFRVMRVGAFVAGCGFGLHAFFDVPGHQLGSLWPGLFVASMALHPAMRRAYSRVVPFIFRIVGVALILIGSVWWASLAGYFRSFPTLATLDQLQERMRSTYNRNDSFATVEVANVALRIAPLEWSTYQARGAAALAVREKAQALNDFAAARVLLPSWPDLRLKQGLLLAQADDADGAFNLWREALNLFPDQAAELYGQIYQWIKNDPDLLEQWREMGRENRDCLLFFFRTASAVDFTLELQRLLFDNPDLQSFTPEQLNILFSAWYSHGDKLALAETLRAHPRWEGIGWRELARVYSDYQDYRQAYETLVHYAGVSLPEILPNESTESLGTRFRVAGGETDGLRLARVEAAHGQVDDALAIIAVLSSRSRPSPLVRYVEAELWARKQDWPKAWRAMWQYVEEAKR
jgi:tetratricopeptide (TPR) repeat protein/O-antigen ligase